MPDKKIVPVRFYSETDEDLIEWLEGLATGEGNNTIKAMLRVGIAASQNGKCHPPQSISGVSMATLDPASLQAALESFLPRIRDIVDKETDAWGLKVSNVELKDISLPPDMERTIAKQAEAEREKRAVIITSEGELAAAQNMSQAAAILSQTPGALHLRTLQSINDVSSDQSNTVIFTLPIELIKAMEGFGKKDHS